VFRPRSWSVARLRHESWLLVAGVQHPGIIVSRISQSLVHQVVRAIPEAVHLGPVVVRRTRNVAQSPHARVGGA